MNIEPNKKYFFKTTKQLDAKKTEEILITANKKGYLPLAVAESFQLIIDNPLSPVLESIIFPELLKYYSIEDLYCFFIKIKTEYFDKSNDSLGRSDKADGWINLVFAFAHFPSVREQAVSVGNSMLKDLAVRLFEQITNTNTDGAWRRDEQKSGDVKKHTLKIGKGGIDYIGSFYLSTELSEKLEKYITSHYDYSVRDDLAVFARIFGTRCKKALEECMEKYPEYEISRLCKESLDYISITEFTRNTLNKNIVIMLESPQRASVKGVILKRLRGNMQDSYADSVARLLSDDEPVFVIQALMLLCECWSAQKISSAALWLIDNRTDPFIILYALRLLFELRNVWIMAPVIKNGVSSFFERTQPHLNSVWVFRAAAARLMGICGKKDILIDILNNDICYEVRVAAFVGLGGIETENGGIKKPARRTNDTNPLDDLKKEWLVKKVKTGDLN